MRTIRYVIETLTKLINPINFLVSRVKTVKDLIALVANVIIIDKAPSSKADCP